MRLAVAAPARRINALTPLIDIVFLLLVFLMLTTDFGRMLTLPLMGAGSGGVAVPSASPLPVLELRGDGTAAFAGQAGDDAAIIAAAADHLRQAGRADLMVGAGVPVQRVVGAIDMLGGRGIAAVTLGRSGGGVAP